jgi:hypothetical protein
MIVIYILLQNKETRFENRALGRIFTPMKNEEKGR